MSSVGLVLGAGGVVGQAYHAGVLAVLEHDCGWDPRSADVIVGTSAGSITGTLLRAGVPASELAAWAVQGSAVRRGPGPARHPRHRVARVRAVPAVEPAPAAGPSRLGHAAAGRTPPVELPPAGRRAVPAGTGASRHRQPAGGPGRGRGAVLARAGPVDLRGPPPRRQAGGLRPAGNPGGPAAPGDRRVVRDPGLLRPGRHLRPDVRRRRRALADQRRGPAPARPGPRDRRLADVRTVRPPDRPVRRVPVARRAGGPQRGPRAARARDRGRRLPARVGRAGGDGQRLHGPRTGSTRSSSRRSWTPGRTPPAPARARSSPASASTAAADRPATSPHRTHRSARIRTLRVRIRAARCVRSGRTAATAGCRRLSCSCTHRPLAAAAGGGQLARRKP